MKPVIILAGTTIGSVLSLSKEGFKSGEIVIVVCFDPTFLSIYKESKFISKAYYTLPNDLFCLCQEIISEYSFSIKPILYCTTDEQCLMLNKLRTKYDELFDLCLPSCDIVTGYNKKGNAEKLADKQGLLVPKSTVINNFEDITYIINSFSFPVIVKPISSTTKVGYKFKIIDKIEFKKTFLDIEVSYGDILCQEYIPGEDTMYKFFVFYRNVNGEILECIGNKSKQINGIMAVGTTEYDKELSDICRAFLHSINYVGIGGLEFKKFKDKYYFIEMSTRPEGFIAISEMAGVSLSHASYIDLCNLDVNFNLKQKDNVKYVSLLMIFLNNIRKIHINVIFCYFLKCLFNSDTYCLETFIDIRCYFKSFKSILSKSLFKYVK